MIGFLVFLELVQLAILGWILALMLWPDDSAAEQIESLTKDLDESSANLDAAVKRNKP